MLRDLGFHFANSKSFKCIENLFNVKLLWLSVYF